MTLTTETVTPAKTENVRQFLQGLIDGATKDGYIITVEQRPLHPLAMGHYETVVDVRPARTNPVLVRVGQGKQTEGQTS